MSVRPVMKQRLKSGSWWARWARWARWGRRSFFVACLLPRILSAQDRWTPELSIKVATVADVVPSPDGKLAAWTETRAVMDGEKSEMLMQVFLAQSDGTGRVQLTRGEKSSEAPAFSADGRYVIFASERDGRKNLYRVAVNGGEAERLSDWKGAMASFQLSPDGKWIAFAGREADPDEELAKREKRDFRVIDENPKNHSLWIIPFESDAKRPARGIASGPWHAGSIAWSPDSRRIAFGTHSSPAADALKSADIREVEIETGKTADIAASAAIEAQPSYSPDGRRLAFVRSANPPSVFSDNRIALFDRQTGQVRELPATFDGSPNIIAWSKDSTRVYFSEARRTRSGIHAMPVDGAPLPLLEPAAGVIGQNARMNASGAYLGFTKQSAAEPVEAFMMDVASARAVKVSDANPGPRPPLGETSVVRWKSKDGMEIEGLLTLPTGYAKGTKCPLILVIHGGPSGVFGETFIGAHGPYPTASFASKGYAVLRPNPRGSSAYGRAFRSANLNDWGGGDYRDLMSGIDSVITQGIADERRLAVMGWSYGGYMTNWVITQTSRFKAAAAGAGLSNLISMWGTNDVPTVLDDYFSGPSYEQIERYARLSPLRHAGNVTTPTLILHGEADVRVPTSQGYEMYSAIKRHGVPAQMVVYPRAPHGPREPKFVLDIMQRHLDWVEKYVR
ncbi:MAG: S9 family peptidase [Bryobacterales bacterium]|nr:S9 family peptidase [Bryobacterales bacterium]